MGKEHEMGEDLQANLGVVIKGDIYELRDMLKTVQDRMRPTSTMQLVYKKLSAAKLWIKEGEKDD